MPVCKVLGTSFLRNRLLGKLPTSRLDTAISQICREPIIYGFFSSNNFETEDATGEHASINGVTRKKMQQSLFPHINFIIVATNFTVVFMSRRSPHAILSYRYCL